MEKKKIIIIAVALLLGIVVAVIIGVGSKYSFDGEPKICLDAGHGGDEVGAVKGD